MIDYNDKQSFNIQSLIRKKSEVEFTSEYNCLLRRVIPDLEIVDIKRDISEFGTILVVVKPGIKVDRHRHDEEEMFYVISGKAELELEGNTAVLSAGDTIYIPRFWYHQVINTFDDEFTFLDIYWDNQKRNIETYECIIANETGRLS
ncbi:MAG: cupin domain-containing protein [Thiotrichaceae bacterium]